MAKALSVCPVCAGALRISELGCTKCGATIRSTFEPCRFCSLGQEHLSFIELFLRCEGNLSRVEKELNLSYPTVRNRLGAAIAALDLNEQIVDDVIIAGVDTAERRRLLLDELARGEVSADAAAEMLKRMS